MKKIENLITNVASAVKNGITSQQSPVQILNNAQSILLNSQIALGFAYPRELPQKEGTPIPELPKRNVETGELAPTTFQAPVKLRLKSAGEGDAFLLPVDPIISINGRNVITRRYVAKGKCRGSIKELWSQDDYDISISGILCADENRADKEKSLNDYLNKLQVYCNANESIHITCNVLNEGLGINFITIESYDFPFTKGIEYQSFTIKAYSDDSCLL